MLFLQLHEPPTHTPTPARKALSVLDVGASAMYIKALGKYIRGRSTRDAHIERSFHIKNRARFGHNVYEILDLISGERKNSIFSFSLPKCVVVDVVGGGESEASHITKLFFLRRFSKAHNEPAFFITHRTFPTISANSCTNQIKKEKAERARTESILRTFIREFHAISSNFFMVEHNIFRHHSCDKQSDEGDQVLIDKFAIVSVNCSKTKQIISNNIGQLRFCSFFIVID